MEVNKLQIGKCYSVAWKSFAKWWIPICLISAVIFIFQIIPRIIVSPEINEFEAIAKDAVTAAKQQDAYKLEEIIYDVQFKIKTLIGKLLMLGLYTVPFIALFTVILLMYANWAVKDTKENRRPLVFLIYISAVHMLLAVVKMLLIFLLFPLGAYIYVKLLFVSLIMIEGKKGALEAINISWKMTAGNFWSLFLLVAINLVIQMLSTPTVIGLIPATGFVNTARASAFRILWQERI